MRLEHQPANRAEGRSSIDVTGTERLLALTGDRETLSGPAGGKDLQSVDGVTETVTIQRGTEKTVLTASGKPSFDTGKRRELLDLLHSITEDLQRGK